MAAYDDLYGSTNALKGKYGPAMRVQDTLSDIGSHIGRNKGIYGGLAGAGAIGLGALALSNKGKKKQEPKEQVTKNKDNKEEKKEKAAMFRQGFNDYMNMYKRAELGPYDHEEDRWRYIPPEHELRGKAEPGPASEEDNAATSSRLQVIKDAIIAHIGRNKAPYAVGGGLLAGGALTASLLARRDKKRKTKKAAYGPTVQDIRNLVVRSR